nr:DNA-directed DNA polymerase [Tanacetum cinerariifolium]
MAPLPGKISDIKGIDPRFYTHKILMEDDYKSAVQSQRRVNPKIHDVIKKEVIKLLDAGYFQIPIDPQNQEKTTFTCPYGTFAYRRMPFGLCNAPGTFQRCMMSIFHDMIEKTIEVFMDDFLVFGDTFSSFLTNLDKMLKRCEETNLFLNWKNCHFMCREGIVLGFSKIAKPMTHLLEKETPFIFSTECIDAFNTLKKKLTEAPILVVPDWNLPFELMCDASDYAIGAVLGQCKSKHFQPIHYARYRFHGPFPSSKGNKYILVAVDYLSKLVEAKALPTNDARVVVKFLKSLFSRFVTAYHPQMSGQVKVSNHGLKRILERTVVENRTSHDSPSSQKEVKTRMRILSVIGIKVYSRYGDFEDLNLLLLLGYLDHLPGSDKRMLSTAVKLWTRNLVTRQRVENIQLGIKSYQTQLNLTKPGWDATGYEFKRDYTIIESPRAIVFPVNNNERKIMRFNEIYKFSDDALIHYLEALDYRVKEFKVKRLNPGMYTRFWTQKDVTRSKEFIAAIER